MSSNWTYFAWPKIYLPFNLDLSSTCTIWSYKRCAEFQRAIDSFVEQKKLKYCCPYLDDVTIAGIDQSDHDRNLKAFYEAAAKGNLTINAQKTQ